MAAELSGSTGPGRVERTLLAIGARRDRLATRLTRACTALFRALRRAGQILTWALTLRLPGEMGYWLQARRKRRPLLRGFLGRRFMLPHAAATPSVSVIIPIYGQVPMTRRCLASIAAHAPKAATEVIVIDDCSGDERLARLKRIRGLRLLSTPRNLGFIGACNHAGRFARGEFLLFLNNDTQVRPGWLDSLRDLLLARPDAGAAGSKLLFPDGTLQEAGGVIWADGSGANVGRGDDPAKPVYNYVREVDYASGASLMIRRHLFEELGGFDPIYAPAYYEDADIAFRLRLRGYATLYQPRSEVVHIEGVSHGTDPRAGIKAHQILNQDRFVARWSPVLKAQHMPRGMRPMRARDHAGSRAIALVVEHCAPEPDRDAGSQTMLAFLRALCGADVVVKLWVEVIRPEKRYVAALRDVGVEVIAGGLAAFEAWIAENGAEIDRVLLSRPDVAAAHLGAIRRHCTAPVAFYGHDLHHRRLRAQFAVSGVPSLVTEAARLEHLERWLWRATDTVLMPSDEEAALIAKTEPGVRSLAVSPYAFDTFGERREPPDGADLLFVGGFAHSPNEDAVVWLATEVLPLVRARVPDVRLLAAGSHVTPRIWSLAGPGVAIHADVTPDALRKLYASARVAVAPLRYGAGVKLKVVEALREGTPLVTTPTGAQGLPDLDRIVDVATDAASFAAAVCRLLTDDALWETRCAAQIDYASARFGLATLRDGLLDALRLPMASLRQPVSTSVRGATVRSPAHREPLVESE